jgi:hypothetical protein
VFLGRELQRARVAAGFKSQDALSVRLGFDRTVITTESVNLYEAPSGGFTEWRLLSLEAG